MSGRETAGRSPPGGQGRGRNGSLLPLNIASFVLVIAGWQVLSMTVAKEDHLPSPATIAQTFLDELLDGALLEHIGWSSFRVLAGFLLSLVMAVPIGFLMGWYRTARGLLEPYVQFLRTVPPIAMIPLVIVVFRMGIDEQAKIFVIWLASFLTLVIAVYQGVRNVDPTLVKAARVLGAGDRSLFFDVVVPASTPYIMVGMRLGLGAAWATLVAAELIAANRGLGYMIQEAGTYGRVDVIILGVLIIGCIGLTMDRAVLALERALTPWQERARQ